jgi:hypothetical protein
MDILNIFLYSLIRIIHISIILFVLIIPFLKIPKLLIIHILFSFLLMLHWYNNSNLCFLSLLESKLRGIKITDTFIHELIIPIYSINKYKLNTIIWVITIILTLISIRNLYYSNFNYKELLYKIYNF